jgi:transcriptional regulator with GAF, ATPase, and Fis domain
MRREDILPLARECLRAASQKLNASTPPLSEQAEQALLAYDFPGNIRELQNMIERAVVLQRSEGGELEFHLVRRGANRSGTILVGAAPALEPEATSADVIPAASFRDLERKNILAALDRCSWRVAGERGAAKLLGLKPSTLAYQMKTLGIERRGSAD